MRDLVHEGDVNLLLQFGKIRAGGKQRLAKQHNAVGQFAVTITLALGDGNAVVEPEGV